MMERTWEYSAPALLVIAMLGGCSAGARVIKRGPDGGRLHVWGPTVPSGQQARKLMVQHCAGPYEVQAQVPEGGRGDTLSYRCRPPAPVASLAVANGTTKRSSSH